MSIIVENITKKYGSQKALDSVSFKIEKGKIVGFIGPNGAGKSTMMKIITGYIPPTTGNIRVDSLDILKDAVETRKHIGYLPENNPLYPEMYVKEYLNYVARHYQLSDTKSRIEGVIEDTGLTREQHKQISQLSKGYRQRVGLAQAIIHDPSVLILDEPTSGLDPNQIIEIRNLISSLGERKTVFLSTHLMQEVQAICDQVIIINQGKIVASGKPDEISSSINEKTNTILVEFNISPNWKDIEGIEGVIRVKPIKEKEVLIESLAGKDIRQKVFEMAVEKGLSVLTIQKKEKSLEEAFQELTNQ